MNYSMVMYVYCVSLIDYYFCQTMLSIPISIAKQYDSKYDSFITQFSEYLPQNLKQMVEQLKINNTNTSLHQPLYTAFVMRLHMFVHSASTNETIRQYYIDNYKKFSDIFINRTTLQIADEPLIPQFNLPHYGNICHLNSSLNILASCAYVLMPYYNCNDAQVKCIVQEVINNISPINVNPINVTTLIRMLHIDISIIYDMTITFKNIMRILYNVISLSDILYWDTADTFIVGDDKQLSFEDLVYKYKPKYLIVNSQDFNVVTNVESNRDTLVEYKCKELTYSLISVSLMRNLHFITAFRVDVSCVYSVLNDLNGRFQKQNVDMSKRLFEISIACYRLL